MELSIKSVWCKYNVNIYVYVCYCNIVEYCRKIAWRLFCLFYRLGEEWKEPVHSTILSESRELLPDEESDEDQDVLQEGKNKPNIEEKEEKSSGKCY